MKLFSETLINLASVEGIYINQHLIYDSDGNVIGKIDLHYYSEHNVFVNLLAIYPEYRNRGYFDQMISLICRAADKNGDTLQLIPLPTETDKIPCSGITIEKLQSIYSSYG
ncbi:MAG: GNAT family N-acetyltransferase, partial [Ignavibacteria bacterium]